MRSMRLVLVIGALLFGSLSSRADIVCDNATYHGIYSFQGVGAFVVLPPQGAFLLGEFAQAGTFDVDGKGHLFVTSSAAYNGYVLPANVPGTYQVGPDCVVAISVILPPPTLIPSTFVGILADGARVMNLMINSPSGTVVVGHHLKQDLKFCGPQDFSGGYQVELQGAVARPASKAGPFLRTGTLTSDGNGHFTAKTIANYNGRVVEEDFDGTYTMNVRCFVTLNYTFGGEDFTLNGSLGGHGELASIMVLNQGYSIAGTLKSNF